jgi:hypothetical protein
MAALLTYFFCNEAFNNVGYAEKRQPKYNLRKGEMGGGQ